MPRPRNTATAFLPAIKALRSDLTRFELQVVQTRELIARLCAIAGIPSEQATAPGEAAMVPKAKGTRGSLRGRKKGSGGRSKDKSILSGGTKSEPPDKDAPTLAELGASKQAKPDDKATAAELSKVVAVIADAAAQEAAAVRDKDVEKLKGAVSARIGAERRAGQLLVLLAGRLRPLRGISKVQSKKYRRDADLTDEEFAGKVLRAQRRAVQSLGAPAKKPAKKPAPAKRLPRSPPRLAMQISDWREEPDGSRSRSVTAVDGGGGAEAS
jgi:hypothetical protein